MKNYFLCIVLLLSGAYVITEPQKPSPENMDTPTCGHVEAEKRQRALVKDRVKKFFTPYLPAMPKPSVPSFSCTSPCKSTTNKIRDFFWKILRRIT